MDVDYENMGIRTKLSHPWIFDHIEWNIGLDPNGVKRHLGTMILRNEITGEIRVASQTLYGIRVSG